ncbi:Phototropin-2 [Daldinia childiae]|uniref:Phototropin-2 n=1 Tax=Daldinia childiae TaxID=326645 RepID=UPI0014486F0C|nr:Phototropin-2 [Daldinia childiae]KAF3062395.1 Phototropin-2 [Daldinia childiae]
MSVRSFAAFKNYEDEVEDDCSLTDILEKRSSLGASVVDAVSSPTTFKRIWEETETNFPDRQPSRRRRPESIRSNPERGRTGLVSSTSPIEPPSTETRSASSSPGSLISQSTKSRENSSSTSPAPGDGTALPGLQSKGPREYDELMPLTGDEIDQASIDLVSACDNPPSRYSLEIISEALFSAEHLDAIFHDQLLLERFTSFLCVFRPKSVPLLVYYLDALKALKAIGYSNTIIRSLVSVKGTDLCEEVISNTINEPLLARLSKVLHTLATDDLPAYITHTWIQTVAVTIKQRITNTLPDHLKDLSEGVADVFCLIDPSRNDNPIVFASKGFHQMTQYGASYALGRNCRFLQGPSTSQLSARRIKEHLDAGKEHCEVLLNYRRDGSPFMNLVMAAPLLDSRGIIRYHISAQVDVSGLAKEYIGFESLRRIVDQRQHDEDASVHTSVKDEFRELVEMFTPSELKIVQEVGGSMHRRRQDDAAGSETRSRHHGLARVDSDPLPRISTASVSRVTSLFEHYLLVRPHPHLRVLFASPSLRFPGMLQSSFMSRIGGPHAVREAVAQAFADGSGVTTKVRWVTRMDSYGKSKWIHCTPLLGSNGAVGVWMVVLVNDDAEASLRRSRDAPLVDVKIDGKRPFDGEDTSYGSGNANGGLNGCRPSSALGNTSGAVAIEVCTSGSSDLAHKKVGSTTM